MFNQTLPNKKRSNVFLDTKNKEPLNKKPRIDEEIEEGSDSDNHSQSDSDAVDEYPYDLMVSFQSSYNRAMNGAKPAPVEDLSHYVSWIVEMLHRSLERKSTKMYIHFKMDKSSQNILCSTSSNLNQHDCILGKATSTIVQEVLACDNKREPIETLQRILELSYTVLSSAPESTYLNSLLNYTIVLTFKPQPK